MAQSKDIVLYHYSFSPYARRVVWYLALRNIPYTECVSLLSSPLPPHLHPSKIHTNSFPPDPTTNPPPPRPQPLVHQLPPHPSHGHRSGHLPRYPSHHQQIERPLSFIRRAPRPGRNGCRIFGSAAAFVSLDQRRRHFQPLRPAHSTFRSNVEGSEVHQGPGPNVR